MHYTYVLLRERVGRLYAGSTSDLRARLREHGARRVRSTACRGLLTLIYYGACLDLGDARRRERFLKSGKGKRYLTNRPAASLEAIQGNKLERH